LVYLKIKKLGMKKWYIHFTTVYGVVYWLLSPPATEEIGAMGREIESRLGIGW
jgi:hypothetical protein